jgi:uncharacterized membrane protein (UPF0127 family)
VARTALAGLTALVLIAAPACGYGDDGAAPEPTPTPPPGAPEFGHGTVILDKGDETVLVRVEVAQSAEQRRFGLMSRKSLSDDAGMVFLYFDRHRGAFWMKDTLIPLSIAFFDREGRILRILDMSPCRREPCKLYDPGVSYWGALEVNRGAFARWGVEPGDSIRLSQ